MRPLPCALGLALLASPGIAPGQEAAGKAPPPPPPKEEPAIHLGLAERVKVFVASKRLEMDGEVCVNRGAIEYVACARGGKVHEAILLVKCRPEHLNTGFILLGLKDGVGPAFVTDPTKPQGDRVVVEVEWKRGEEAVKKRLEDLVWDVRSGAPMPRVTWVYVGSEFVQDPRTGREVFAAERERDLIATMHDPSVVLDSPLPTGADDTAYVANADVLPARGTPVRVTARLPTEAEAAESKRNEEKAEKEWAERTERDKAEQARRDAEERAAREGGGAPPVPGAGEEAPPDAKAPPDPSPDAKKGGR
ncbi:MAG: YdjY domain-containing protein [Planctomycetales bacterium]|nr:YdjY domain-containing protein [Planctomycetales bacterium]